MKLNVREALTLCKLWKWETDERPSHVPVTAGLVLDDMDFGQIGLMQSLAEKGYAVGHSRETVFWITYEGTLRLLDPKRLAVEEVHER